MRPRQLLATSLALTLLVSGIAAGQELTDPPPDPSLLSNVTLSCSVTAPTLLAGCFVERPVLVVGGLELALGLDAQAVLTGAADVTFAPYGIVAYYGDSWSVWGEVMLPEVAPVLGSPDWLRVGFSYRFEEPP